MKSVLKAVGAAFLVLSAGGAASAQDVNETLCVQGSYAPPCPQVIWCPATNCGIGIPRTDGTLEVLYSTDEEMDGTTRRPVLAGNPMTLQNVAGRIIVFEWDDAGEGQSEGADLPIKDIHYVIMGPQTPDEAGER